jgi:hypothetical protein
MKYTATLLIGLLLLPLASFAATTNYSPQYIAELQQLLALLEQELQAILATAATPPVSTVATSTIGTSSTPVASGMVQVSVGNSTAYMSINGAVYGTTLTVTNGTNSTIYVPAALNYVSSINGTSNVPGITYAISGTGTPATTYVGTGNGTVDCSPQVELPVPNGYVQGCEILAGQSSQIMVNPTPEPSSTNEGFFTLSITSLTYSDTASNPAFVILPVPSNQTTSITL